MNNKIVIASNNQGKLSEFSQLLAKKQFDVLPQNQFFSDEVDETGLSFVENAIIKARHACQQSGLAAIADDSGLEVDFLYGAPGIYSARYAEDWNEFIASDRQRRDQLNIDKLLASLNNIPYTQRTARYQCVLVMMRHANDPSPLIVQASWEGHIHIQRQGKNGFGYDPVFWLEDLSCTSAQLSAEQKNQISHRAKALQRLMMQI